MMAPILVTGGAHYVAAHLIQRLLADGERVRVLDTSRGAWPHWLPVEHEKLEIIQGDIRNWKTVQQCVEGARHVFHFAGQFSLEFAVEYPRVSSELNLLGFTNLLDSLRQSGFEGKLLYASDDIIYGEQEKQRTLKEKYSYREESTNPLCFELRSAERMAAIYQRYYGINTVALRYFDVYGPQMEGTQYAPTVPNLFCAQVHAEGKVTVMGDGNQCRDFLYIDDAVDLTLACMNTPTPQALNIASGQAASLNDVVRALSRISGKSIDIQRQAERPGDRRRVVGDTLALRKAVGDYKFTTLEEGLRSLLSTVDSSDDTVTDAPVAVEAPSAEIPDAAPEPAPEPIPEPQPEPVAASTAEPEASEPEAPQTAVEAALAPEITPQDPEMTPDFATEEALAAPAPQQENDFITQSSEIDEDTAWQAPDVDMAAAEEQLREIPADESPFVAARGRDDALDEPLMSLEELGELANRANRAEAEARAAGAPVAEKVRNYAPPAPDVSTPYAEEPEPEDDADFEQDETALQEPAAAQPPRPTGWQPPQRKPGTPHAHSVQMRRKLPSQS